MNSNNQQSKRGRKPTGRSRDTQIQVRLSTEEHQAITALAEEAQTTIAALLRKYIVSKTEAYVDRDKTKQYISVVINQEVNSIEKEEAKSLLKSLMYTLLDIPNTFN